MDYVAITSIIGLVLGAIFGAGVGRAMARDVIQDWSNFPSFLGGIGCYIIWMLIIGLVGFATGPGTVPAAIICVPVYMGHRYYFNRRKVNY